MILYDHDSNTILAEPGKNQTDRLGIQTCPHHTHVAWPTCTPSSSKTRQRSLNRSQTLIKHPRNRLPASTAATLPNALSAPLRTTSSPACAELTATFSVYLLNCAFKKGLPKLLTLAWLEGADSEVNKGRRPKDIDDRPGLSNGVGKYETSGKPEGANVQASGSTSLSASPSTSKAPAWQTLSSAELVARQCC